MSRKFGLPPAPGCTEVVPNPLRRYCQRRLSRELRFPPPTEVTRHLHSPHKGGGLKRPKEESGPSPLPCGNEATPPLLLWYQQRASGEPKLPPPATSNEELISFIGRGQQRPGLPGSPVVKNPPANAWDTDSVPAPERFHMPRGN